MVSGKRWVVSAALLAAVLAGCAQVPAMSALKLAGFDPMKADPATIRAAVALPSDAFPPTGGARLVLAQARRDGRDAQRLEVVLEEVPLVSETGLAAVRAKPGQVIRAFRIPAADRARLIETRAGMLARAAAEPGAFAGTLQVEVAGCLKPGAEAPKRFPVSTWLKTAETGDYVTLLEDVDLISVLGDTEFRQKTGVCPAG